MKLSLHPTEVGLVGAFNHPMLNMSFSDLVTLFQIANMLEKKSSN